MADPRELSLRRDPVPFSLKRMMHRTAYILLNTCSRKLREKMNGMAAMTHFLSKSFCVGTHYILRERSYVFCRHVSRKALSRDSRRLLVTSSLSSNHKKVVFLGTPEVAALVLERLLEAASQPAASFEIAAVVTQPGRPRGRGRSIQPSPVETLARHRGIPENQIMAPLKASDPVFLQSLESLAPDLCITAAYGNYLPTKFLRLPLYGTLNIHPSLLPNYRGAAPVQRSLEDGVRLSGVTVLYTVKEMDAGPILAQKTVNIDGNIQAPQLLNDLFEVGADLLLSKLPEVFSGKVSQDVATPQDHSAATHAAKIERGEGLLSFSDPALTCHNKVRALAGWPGTYHTFAVESNEDDALEDMELKIIESEVALDNSMWTGSSSQEVSVGKTGLCIKCGDGNVLRVLKVQAPGKKAASARDFANGFSNKKLYWKRS